MMCVWFAWLGTVLARTRDFNGAGARLTRPRREVVDTPIVVSQGRLTPRAANVHAHAIAAATASAWIAISRSNPVEGCW